MRIDRILGVILSILVISFIVLKQFNTDEEPFELIGDNGYMENSSIALQEEDFRDTIGFFFSAIFYSIGKTLSR